MSLLLLPFFADPVRTGAGWTGRSGRHSIGSRPSDVLYLPLPAGAAGGAGF
jgi:hypothetical protein